jgi:hypothetical protein
MLADGLRDPVVRDLAWLLFSPDLLRSTDAGAPLAQPFASDRERDAAVAWLAALDSEPGALHAHVNKPNLARLGLYAEALLEYFLAHGPGSRLIAANLPLRVHRQTIGEVDFLVESTRGERLHWELAVKFYLHVADGDNVSLANYIGPNLQDRFDLKQRRLLNHQLMLSSRPEFASLGFDGPWQPGMFIKGRLFYHDNGSPGTSAPCAPSLADNHLRGWWKTASEWRELAAGHAWDVLPRLSWLAPHVLAEHEGAALAEREPALLERVASLRWPLMVATYAPASDGGHWQEQSRGFIVPDHWPERARDYVRATILAKTDVDRFTTT